MDNKHYILQEWVTDEEAIGGIGFWTDITPGYRLTPDLKHIEELFDMLKKQGRKVRVIEVTEKPIFTV